MVRTGQEYSNSFDVMVVACQSSVFSPLLFAIMIDIVTKTREEKCPGNYYAMNCKPR